MEIRAHFYRLAASIAAAIFMLATAAVSQAAPGTATVTVLADRYVVAGRAFDSLRALEAHLNVLRPQGLRIQACGTTSIRQWKAAMYRFRNLPLEPGVLNPHEAECSSAQPLAIRAGSRAGQSDDIDDLAVNRYWRELMP